MLQLREWKEGRVKEVRAAWQRVEAELDTRQQRLQAVRAGRSRDEREAAEAVQEVQAQWVRAAREERQSAALLSSPLSRRMQAGAQAASGSSAQTAQQLGVGGQQRQDAR